MKWEHTLLVSLLVLACNEKPSSTSEIREVDQPTLQVKGLGARKLSYDNVSKTVWTDSLRYCRDYFPEYYDIDRQNHSYEVQDSLIAEREKRLLKASRTSLVRDRKIRYLINETGDTISLPRNTQSYRTWYRIHDIMNDKNLVLIEWRGDREYGIDTSSTIFFDDAVQNAGEEFGWFLLNTSSGEVHNFSTIPFLNPEKSAFVCASTEGIELSPSINMYTIAKGTVVWRGKVSFQNGKLDCMRWKKNSELIVELIGYSEKVNTKNREGYMMRQRSYFYSLVPV